MKKFSILALVLAFVMMFSVVSFAADSFKLSDPEKVPAGTTVEPDATEIAVTTGTADGNYYGILLVEGDDLPVVDNAILYIDQLTGDGSEKAVTVKPIMPAVGTDLTLYISSNTGADLIKIPMVYSADKVDEPVIEYEEKGDALKADKSVEAADGTTWNELAIYKAQFDLTKVVAEKGYGFDVNGTKNAITINGTGTVDYVLAFFGVAADKVPTVSTYYTVVK